jgi:hypothetical protein
MNMVDLLSCKPCGFGALRRKDAAKQILSEAIAVPKSPESGTPRAANVSTNDRPERRRKMARIREDATIRCGVFDTVEQAERAVDSLLAAGFSKDQISVLCSDAGKEEHFGRFHHQDPAGSHTPGAITAGGIIGAALGGLIGLGVTTAAGLTILGVGPLLAGGAVAGGLIGAMETRGSEGALADFYDQALTHGKLLVAVEDTGPNHDAWLGRAEQILQHAGAAPLPLEHEV